MPRDLQCLAHCLEEIRPFSLRIYGTVDSTNNLAKKLIQSGVPNFIAIVADSQTAGRGRRGRQWISPPGVNIYTSIILPKECQAPEIAVGRPQLHPLLASVVVCDTLRSVAPEVGRETGIKWPNDILISERKIAGILVERTSDGSSIIGIGININMTEDDFPPELRERGCSLYTVTGRRFQRGEILKEMLRGFRDILGITVDDLLREWTARSCTIQTVVKASMPDGHVIKGVARGIDREGRLIVDAEGERWIINSADIEHIR